VRPHAERGPCSTCHNVVLGATASAYLPAQAFAVAAPYAAYPTGFTDQGAGMPRGQLDAQGIAYAPVGAAGVYAYANGPAFAASSPVAGRPSPVAIAEGAIAPHGERGLCSACHTIVQPGAAAANFNAAPAQAAARNVGEAEALGMAVRPTSGDVQGMLVVEVEGLARRAGLQLGDIIRAVDGQMTSNLAAFVKVSRGADPTRGVLLDVTRDGKGLVLVMR